MDNVKMYYFFNEDGVFTSLPPLPPNSVDITETINSSKTVGILKKQVENQQRQIDEYIKDNKRRFIISLITSAISTAALIVSIISFYFSLQLTQ